jgi:hypothetical protein
MVAFEEQSDVNSHACVDVAEGHCRDPLYANIYAFDTLVIPAMSVKCESLSGTKKRISPERNSLAEETII